MTKLEEAKKRFDEAVALHEKAVNDLKPFTKACSKAYDVAEKAKERYFSLVVKGNVPWDVLLEANDSSVTHKKFDKALEKYCLTHSCYRTETMQRIVKIALYKNKDDVTQKTLEGIKVLLPFIKPVDIDGTKVKIFSILEKHLSADGIYELLINKSNQALVMITSYGSESFLSSWDTLENTLNLIQRKYYYNSSESDA